MISACDLGAAFGTGIDKIASFFILGKVLFSKEVATHNIKIPFSIEFEADWDKNQPKVAECVRFFDATAKTIVATR